MKGLNNRVNSNGLKLKMQVMNISIHMCEYIKDLHIYGYRRENRPELLRQWGFCFEGSPPPQSTGGCHYNHNISKQFYSLEIWQQTNKLFSRPFRWNFWRMLSPGPASSYPPVDSGFEESPFFHLLIWSLPWVMTVFAFQTFPLLCQVGLQTK